MIKKALDAGVKDNIIPSTARAILNCRVLPGETIKSTEDYIRATIGD
ncbi:MAG: peptidase dimerization domain-containing protein, partial [Bacteroidetes bacterium]|nr:peptidase dimerization domain-containing protein [Bacteroidota bacterium]